MKNILRIFWAIFIITAFLTLWFFLDTKKNNVKNNIFDIYFAENIDLWENFWLEWKNTSKLNYKQKIWKWVFIWEKEFLTAKHLFRDKNKKYFAKVNNKFYNLKLVKKFKNKDLIIWEIINYKNNFNITKTSKIYKNEKVYLYKDNKKIYWRIMEINKNLVKTNIKLSIWDSWTPLFDKDNNLIWIFVLIETQSNFAYAEIL